MIVVGLFLIAAAGPQVEDRKTAGRGAWLKSNAEVILLSASSPVDNGSTFQLLSINLSTEVKSSWVLSMNPVFAKGLTSNPGTRNPYPEASTWGGATWSYQPPQSS